METVPTDKTLRGLSAEGFYIAPEGFGPLLYAKTDRDQQETVF